VSDTTNERPRVVVAGVGAITAQGATAEAFWEGVKEGRVAIRPVQRLPMTGYRTTLGGEVQHPPTPVHDYRRPAGHRDAAFDYALTAAEEAMASCGAGLEGIPAERWGVVIGTCNAGLISTKAWFAARLAEEDADPQLLLLGPPQALAEALSAAFQIKGPVLSIDTACAAGANALGYAAELIRTGLADAVLTGGTDALSDILYGGFNSLESLSPEPAAPYSKDRQGLSLGEGSGMIVLVREDVAEQNNVPVLAEVLGYGLSADGYHPTAPQPEGKGASRAIRSALAAAGVRPDEVRYVNSHGTGTPKNDPAETKATRLGLGSAADSVAVSSTKSMVGHLLGAAGAVEGIITIKALEHQIAPPTANYREPDPECDLDYVPNAARELAMDVAISNNFAFGGANACVVFGRAGMHRPLPPPGEDRVVVTGMATLTSAGSDPDANWEAFVNGRATTQAENGLQIGRVALDPSPFLSPRDMRRMDRLGVFAVVASRLALQDAGLEVTDENRERIGVVFGTGVGPMEAMEEFSRGIIEEGPAAANPAIFPNTVYNAAGGQVAMRVGTTGPASTVTAGHGASASAICYAADLVETDQAEAMICLGVDTLTGMVIRGYRELGVLSEGDGGFSLAEAGIALVVERLSNATARGARIYGEIVGSGITSDAKGVGRFDPHGRGLERAMRLAIADAHLTPAAITGVWANSAGYTLADEAESEALQRIFGAGEIPTILYPKRLFGEPMGAGGGLNAALALKNWQDPKGATTERGPVLINSCSLGGTNFSIVLAPFAG
jgi:3-oxoacyl-[acyl-carrier-protein] synthase II